ncbi:MAG: hypothetical protein KKC80_08600 [Candidatus Margulisbacteria bacterium]|nr:hypothetical protein [Candidatus Margulisiibacteriota bacterium]
MNKNRVWFFIVTVLLVSWVTQYVLFSGLLPEIYLGYYMYVPALIALIFFFFGKNPIKKQAELFTQPAGLWSWVFAVFYPIFWMGLVAMVATVTGLGKFTPNAFSSLWSGGSGISRRII